MLPRAWKIEHKNPENVITCLLESRGIKHPKAFFNPPHPSTFSLKKVGISEQAIGQFKKRIRIALKKKEVVVIYGDYDVDGVCSTALMWQTLSRLGLIVYPFVPDRFDEGYGMSAKGIDKIKEKHKTVSLIITVDNGIVANTAISYAKEHGINVVVTDHHEKAGKNNADIVIHTTKMCGTAVAWYVSNALLPKSDREYIDEALDLVGIATIADQMKLVGINRSLAMHGINAVRRSKRIGLRMLSESSAIVLSQVGAYEIGFVLGPRMNAAGRLAHALEVVRLLCTNQKGRALEIAHMLSELNTKRQSVTTEVIDLARTQVVESQKISIIQGNFHEGVIGLAAGRLVEETGRPSIVFAVGEAHAKGSARSIPGFHITEALRQFEPLLLSVGGHEMAAGLSVSVSQLPEFIKAFSAYVEKTIEIADLHAKELPIDCELPFQLITPELVTALSQMEPFGSGNPKPVFMTAKVEVLAVKPLGKAAAHVKVLLDQDGDRFEGLIFRIEQFESKPKVGSVLDVVYSIDQNTWNGTTKTELLIKDFKTHE